MLKTTKKAISCILTLAMLLCFAPVSGVYATGDEPATGLLASDYLDFPGVTTGTAMNSDSKYISGGKGFGSLWVTGNSDTDFSNTAPTLAASRTINVYSGENFYLPTANMAALYRKMGTSFDFDQEGVYYYKFRARNNATNTANAFSAEYYLGSNITIALQNPATDLPTGITAAGTYPNLTVGETKVWSTENVGTSALSILVEITVNADGDDTVRVQYADSDAELSLDEDDYQLEITTDLSEKTAHYVGMKSIRYGCAGLGAMEFYRYEKEDIATLKEAASLISGGEIDGGKIGAAIAALENMGKGFFFDSYLTPISDYIIDNNLEDDFKASLVSASVEEDAIIPSQSIKTIDFEFTHSIDDGAAILLTDNDDNELEIEPGYNGKILSIKLIDELVPNNTYTLTVTDLYDFMGLGVDDVSLSFGTDFIPNVNVIEGDSFETGKVLVWEDIEGVTTTAKLNGEEISNGDALTGKGEAVLELKAVNEEGTERTLTVNFTLVEAFAPVASEVKITAEENTLTGSFSFSDKNGDGKGECVLAWYYTDKSGKIIEPIDGAETETYTITEADYNKYIAFEVTPVALTGANNEGTPVLSDPFTAPFSPVATGVGLKGDVRIDETVEIKFDYYDENGDEKGEHVYKWYVCDTLTSEPVEIESTVETNEKTYTVTDEVIGKYFCASITPYSKAIPENGEEYFTKRVLGPVAPVVKNVKITGNARVGNTLSVTYDFFDENLDEEKGSIIEWINTEDDDVIGNGRTLKLTSVLEGETIAVRVKGASIYKPTYSEEYAVSKGVTVSKAGSGGSSGGNGGFTMSGSLSGSEKPKAPEKEEKPASSFNDTASHWAQAEIEALYEKGIISGTGDGNFEPNRSVTRAEIIKMMLSAVNVEASEYTDGFSDVKKENWFAGYVEAALEYGLISKDSNFRPNDAVTRQETAKLLAILMKYEINDDPLEYDDAETIAKWAVPYVGAVTINGLMQGDVNNEFGARGMLTRAEAATVIYRILNK